jgi:uncharacterized phage protein (TIGR01671 family)
MRSDIDGWSDEIGINKMFEYCAENDIKVMQFTGLFDKNGTEIYEGDIVEFYKLSEKVQAEIIWHEEKAMFCHRRNGHINSWHLNADNYEVIGNIYQTPPTNEQ